MSPFIFALFVEPLGELVRAMAHTHGISLPPLRSAVQGAQHFIISQFADDTTIYARSVTHKDEILQCIADEYCVVSGARRNVTKTKVLLLCATSHR